MPDKQGSLHKVTGSDRRFQQITLHKIMQLYGLNKQDTQCSFVSFRGAGSELFNCWKQPDKLFPRVSSLYAKLALASNSASGHKYY